MSEEKGLYVGLRIDGRVRASGTGTPPWAKFAAQLAPLSGTIPLSSGQLAGQSRAAGIRGSG